MKHDLLNNINSIDDLRKLSIDELNILSKEIRNFIIETVAKTGGHLGSNLGTVELTIALHYAYNTPTDKLIWDVGHQAYTHKILTGRKDAFNTLRQYKGISGFLKRHESEFDVFGAGHSSTSISAALGIASARDLNNESYKVIPIIGDASITSGMAFEALNHAGYIKKDLILILNTNEMSIASNVGAISKHFGRIVHKPFINRARQDFESFIGNLPKFGAPLHEMITRFEGSLKNLILPLTIFEEMGFRYFGPVDGHNIFELVQTFNTVKEYKGPLLVNVKTTKGKGYKPAEENAEKFHGVSSFIPETGKSANPKKGVTYTETFGEKLVELAEKNPKVVAITAAMTSGTGLNAFKNKFPDRFFDVGISEQHAVTFAAGMSVQDYIPFVVIYSTFLQRAYDQIIHDVCIQNLPVKFCLDRAGLVGEDGETHHGVLDINYLSNIPNMRLLAPKDKSEFKRMLEFMISYNGPISIRYPRGDRDIVQFDENPDDTDFTKAEILETGKDILFLGFGSGVQLSLIVHDKFKNENKNTSVINMRTINPIDTDLILNEIKRHNIIVTVEEGNLSGGLSDKIARLLFENDMHSHKLIRCGLPDRYITHGNIDSLFKEVGFYPEAILEKIKAVL